MKQLLIMFASCMTLISAQAASFDCAKAGTKVEKLICADSGLSTLDEDLNAAYKTALQDVKQADSIKQAQKQWLKERNSCVDAACVKLAYESRLSTLKSFLAKGANQEVGGKYKMIRDTIDVPHSDGIYTQEKHAEVCTAFLKNLEASTSFPPMACDVTFKSEFTDFITPEWQDMDVLENMDLELQMSPQPKNEAEKAFRLKNTNDLIKASMLAYRTARFDIDNDGRPDQVLARIDNGMCDAKKYADERFWRGYIVYDPVTRKVDFQKSKYYNYYLNVSSLFSYKNVTYYAAFGGSTNEPYFGKNDRAQKWYIRLYRPIPMNQGIRQPAALGCEYLYLPTNSSGSN